MHYAVSLRNLAAQYASDHVGTPVYEWGTGIDETQLTVIKGGTTVTRAILANTQDKIYTELGRLKGILTFGAHLPNFATQFSKSEDRQSRTVGFTAFSDQSAFAKNALFENEKLLGNFREYIEII